MGKSGFVLCNVGGIQTALTAGGLTTGEWSQTMVSRVVQHFGGISRCGNCCSCCWRLFPRKTIGDIIRVCGWIFSVRMRTGFGSRNY